MVLSSHQVQVYPVGPPESVLDVVLAAGAGANLGENEIKTHFSPRKLFKVSNYLRDVVLFVHDVGIDEGCPVLVDPLLGDLKGQGLGIIRTGVLLHIKKKTIK